MSAGSEASSSESFGADTSADGSTGGEPMVLVAARFTIPAGTVVEELVYGAQGTAVDGPTTGRTIVVAIRDLTHVDRDQDALCPGSHPLDGCATVDYGAFGIPHDNHLVVDGISGPVELHLHKSREVLAITEPLPISE